MHTFFLVIDCFKNLSDSIQIKFYQIVLWLLNPAVLTSLPRVDHEAGVVEGGPLDKAVTVSFDPTGVTDLRLDDHDGDGTVDDMTAIL